MTTLHTIFFYIFSTVLLVAAFRVITARNPVHAVIYLVLTFFQAAAIWLLLKAEFLAIVLVLVYVGAVMVLFLFVLMMLNFDVKAMREGFWKLFPAAAAVGGLFSLELGAILLLNYRSVVDHCPCAVPMVRCWQPMRLTPKSWASCFIHSICCPLSWLPCCCWLPSLPPLP